MMTTPPQELVERALIEEVRRQTNGQWPIDTGTEDKPIWAVDTALDFAELAEAAIEAITRTDEVVRLREALTLARDAIASLQEDTLGLADLQDVWTGQPPRYSIRDELLSQIDAALRSNQDGE
ncbi:MAG TPA: hypothetical protein VLG09_03835 [Candidatus Saccharimonadales bacterium]|nr:hypothetical protein [Candidatus Saccharimonadales bacterium]